MAKNTKETKIIYPEGTDGQIIITTYYDGKKMGEIFENYTGL